MRRGSTDRCLNKLKQQIDKPYHLPSQEEMSSEMHQCIADFLHEKQLKENNTRPVTEAVHTRETLE